MQHHGGRVARAQHFAGVGLVALGLIGHAAQAATTVWSNPAGGSFQNGANWGGGLAPGGLTNAQFDLSGDYTVTFAASVTNDNAYFYAPAGTVTLDIGAGRLYQLAAGKVLFMQNAGGAPSLDLISGTLNVGYAIYLGNSSTHNGNRLLVRNPGTTMTTGGDDIFVGLSGDYNLLLVTNGATVSSWRNVRIGYSADGSNNTVVVSGANSRLIANTGTGGAIDVGYQGDNNLLIVEDNAVVSCINGGLSVGDLAGSDGNTVMVRSGGMQTNSAAVYVGNQGAYNTMTVSNGIFASSGYMQVGAGNSFNRLNILAGGSVAGPGHFIIGTAAAARSNTVVVAGSGSSLSSSAYDIGVGRAGDHNLMIVSNGALVTAYRSFFVGANHDSASDAGSDNMLIANGPTTVLSDLGIFAGESIMVGRVGSNNTLRLENGARFMSTNNAVPFIIGNAAGSLSNAAVIGASCIVSNLGQTYVGNGGNANRLSVSNATFSSGFTYCGLAGSGNSLTVEAGGQYRAVGHFYFGNSAGANSNLITVTGSGSALYNTAFDLDVGTAGSYNRMRIADGAAVSIVRNTFVGHNAGSTNNVLEIEGGSFQCNTAGTSAMTVNYGSTLAVHGTGGAVSLRQLLVQNSAGIDLRVDANGITPITCSSSVTFDNSTTLTVDAERYQTAGGGTLTVMTYASRNQGILPGNITVMPAETVVTQTATNLTLTVPGPEGTMLFLE